MVGTISLVGVLLLVVVSIVLVLLCVVFVVFNGGSFLKLQILKEGWTEGRFSGNTM
jgi:hypothetical protein